jgi:hypothetical protein
MGEERVIQGRLSRVLAVMVVVVSATTLTASHSIAQDKELTESTDFRVRVAAAARLGRQGGASAKNDLEAGLHDSHPAVRATCAVALGNIGDASSVAALEAAIRAESFAGVKSAMKEALDKLKGRTSSGPVAVGIEGAKYVVQLGQMTNKASTRIDLETFMRNTAKAKAGSIKHAMILDTSDASVMQRAKERKIPVLLVDGTLSKLTTSTGRDGGTIVTATVDISIRQVPKQTLKGTVSGNASASDDKNTNGNGIQELQNRAVGGAVESAMSSVGSEIALLAK